MDEFRTLLSRIDAVSGRLEDVALSLARCQALYEQKRLHRSRWSDRLWGAAVAIAAGTAGWIARKYQ